MDFPDNMGLQFKHISQFFNFLLIKSCLLISNSELHFLHKSLIIESVEFLLSSFNTNVKLSDTLAPMLAFDTTGEIGILYQDALSRGD